MTTNGGTTMNDLTKAIAITGSIILSAAAIYAIHKLLERRAASRQRAWDTHCNHPTIKHPAAGGPGTARPRAVRRRQPPGPTQWHDSPCGCSAREHPREIYTCPKHAAGQLIDLEAMWQRREDAL